MMGIDIDVDNSIGKEAGIIPRFCRELFERIVSLDDSDVGAGKFMPSSAKVEVSYFEIYNEKIHDLLAGSYDGGKRTPLKVREHPAFGPYVVDLSVRGVTSYEDVKVGFQILSCLRRYSIYSWSIQHVGLQSKFALPTSSATCLRFLAKKTLST